MGTIGAVLIVLFVVLLWVAAIAFGRDPRDVGDRRSGTDPRDRLLRL